MSYSIVDLCEVRDVLDLNINQRLLMNIFHCVGTDDPFLDSDELLPMMNSLLEALR